MHPMLNVAIQAIRKAGDFVIRQCELFDKKNNIQLDNINDLIFKINKKSNYIITTIIQKFYPLHTIITTQHHHNINDIQHKKNVYWILGSETNNMNYIRQFPFFALSIAVQFKGRIEIGVIYDPIHNELFSACRGKGAQLNGYKTRIGTAKNLYKTIIAISFSHEKQHIITNLLNKLYNKYINFRCTGSTILDLAYVAVGRIDGCISVSSENVNNNKLASGALIIQESGGFVIDFTGTKNYLLSGNIIAGNIQIIRTILSSQFQK